MIRLVWGGDDMASDIAVKNAGLEDYFSLLKWSLFRRHSFIFKFHNHPQLLVWHSTRRTFSVFLFLDFGGTFYINKLMTWLLLGFMNFNGLAFLLTSAEQVVKKPGGISCSLFRSKFRCSLFARWIHGKTQSARFSHEVGISHLPILLLRKSQVSKEKKDLVV